MNEISHTTITRLVVKNFGESTDRALATSVNYAIGGGLRGSFGQRAKIGYTSIHPARR